MAAENLTVRDHHLHHSPDLSIASVRLPSLCLQCGIERLEGPCEPTALRKFILSELASVVEGDGAEFMILMQSHLEVLERLLLAVTKQLKSESEQLQEIAVDVCSHLAQQDTSHACLQWLCNEAANQVVDSVPAASCLSCTILLGRLLHYRPTVAAQIAWGAVQDVAIQSLSVASPPVQSALMYALVQLWKGLASPPPFATLQATLRQVAQAVQPSSGLDLLMNGFTLCKAIVSQSTSLADLLCLNTSLELSNQPSAIPVVALLKKGLLHQNAVLQATAAQCCCILTSDHTVAQWCMHSDMVEYLLEALSSKHDIIIREVLAALERFTKHSKFFKGHHAAYGLEPIVEVITTAASQDIVTQGLALVAGFLSQADPSIRIFSGLEMFERLSRILSRKCSPLACIGDKPHATADHKQQINALHALGSLWSLHHLPYDWPAGAMTEAIDVLLAIVMDGQAVFTDDRCRLLTETFQTSINVVSVLVEVRDVIIEGDLSLYMERVGSAVEHILHDQQYQQVTSDEGFAMMEVLLELFMRLMKSEHIRFVSLPVTLAKSDFFPATLGCICARASSKAWSFLEELCCAIGDYHSGLLDYTTESHEIRKAITALSTYRPNCAAKDLLQLLALTIAGDSCMDLAQRAAFTILWTMELHQHSLMPREALCLSLAQFIINRSSLDTLSEPGWRRLLLLLSSLEREEFEPPQQWHKAWFIVRASLLRSGATLTHVYSPSLALLHWIMNTDLPPFLSTLMWSGCLEMLCKQELLAERNQIMPAYVTQEQAATLISAVPASLQPLSEVLCSGSEPVIAMACQLLTQALWRQQNYGGSTARGALEQDQRQPELGAFDAPSSSRKTSPLHLLSDLPAALESILISQRIQPLSDHTCAAVVRLLLVFQQQLLEGQAVLAADGTSLKLTCTVLSLLERHTRQVNEAVLDSSGRLEEAEGSNNLLFDLLSYLTVIGTSSWLLTTPQAASIMLTNSTLGGVLQRLTADSAEDCFMAQVKQISAAFSFLTQIIHAQMALHLCNSQSNWIVSVDMTTLMRCMASKHSSLSVTSCMFSATYLRYCAQHNSSSHAPVGCCTIVGLELLSTYDGRGLVMSSAHQVMAITAVTTRLLLQDDRLVVSSGACLLTALRLCLPSQDNPTPAVYNQWMSSPWLLHALLTKMVYLLDTERVMDSAALVLCCTALTDQQQKELSASLGPSAAVLNDCVASVQKSLQASRLTESSSMTIAIETDRPIRRESDIGNESMTGNSEERTGTKTADDNSHISWFLCWYSLLKATKPRGDSDGDMADITDAVAATPDQAAVPLSSLETLIAKGTKAHCAACKIFHINGVPLVLDAPSVQAAACFW